ncbi:MAG TPA: CHAT domain-containing tetratricopeptide repeat protein [Polyangiaceae bacterium]|nr:CHAT domain-containing tetratricopeptide repeat protein [Polyangiaceae bacterium]
MAILDGAWRQRGRKATSLRSAPGAMVRRVRCLGPLLCCLVTFPFTSRAYAQTASRRMCDLPPSEQGSRGSSAEGSRSYREAEPPTAEVYRPNRQAQPPTAEVYRPNRQAQPPGGDGPGGHRKAKPPGKGRFSNPDRSPFEGLSKEEARALAIQRLWDKAYQAPPELTRRDFPDDVFELSLKAERLMNEGKYRAALWLAQRALWLHESQPEADKLAIVMNLALVGTIHHRLGQFRPAESFFQRALALGESKLGREHLGVAAALNNLAWLYRDLGAYARAEPLLLRALTLRERALGRRHPDVGQSLDNLALLYQAQGAYARAEPLFLRALAIHESQLGREHPAVAADLNYLAGLYRDLGEYARAEPLFERALRIDERELGREHPNTVIDLNDLAGLYLEQGAYDKAGPLYLRALRIGEKAFGQEHPLVAPLLNGLALLYERRGAYEEARPLYLRALRIREQTFDPEHPSVADSLNSLALLYRVRGAYGEAELLVSRALDIRKRALGQEHPDVAEGFNGLAAVYQEQGAYEHASQLHVHALRIREKALGPGHPDVAASLESLASLYQAQGHRQPALAYAARAAAIRERHLDAELGALPEVRKRRLLETVRSEADWLASFQAHDAPGDEDAVRLALVTALRRKGRVLDETATARAALRRNFTSALRAELDELVAKQAELAVLQSGARATQVAMVRALQDEVDRRETELGRKSAAFRAQSTPITIKRVQAALPEDAALVEFVRYRHFDPKGKNHWNEARYVAYVLRRQGPPQSIPLGEAAPIEAAIEAARRALTRPVGEARGPLRALDALIFAPLRPALGETPHLLLAPDAVLHLVPFEALVDEQGSYLLERALLTYLSSGRDLVRRSQHAPARSGPLVVAAPDYGPGGKPFVPLPGATAEAEALRRHFPSASVLTGLRARKDALTQAHAPLFVHVATHGFVRRPGAPPPPAQGAASSVRPRGLRLEGLPPPPDEGDPEGALDLAGLAFAGANRGPDAVLTAREAAGLDLWGTQLVVLSACETGLGQLGDGEGVYGLRRALTVAGAESQVVSLWSVSDAATSKLMGFYYGELAAGAGRSEALRRARLSLLAAPATAHPFYWAAFVPSGDWRPLDAGALEDAKRDVAVHGGACGCRTAGGGAPAGGMWAPLALGALIAGARRRAR